MLYQTDLPDEVARQFQLATHLAVDTETTGLNPRRDRLCLVQVYDGITYAAVQLEQGNEGSAENLIELLERPITKIMHHARFDMGFLYAQLEVRFDPKHVFCTRLANKVTRTACPKHSLINVVADLCGVALNKEQQTSDWGASELSYTQLEYARQDVMYLNEIREAQVDLANRDSREFILDAILSAIHGIVIADISEFNGPDNALFGY